MVARVLARVCYVSARTIPADRLGVPDARPSLDGFDMRAYHITVANLGMCERAKGDCDGMADRTRVGGGRDAGGNLGPLERCRQLALMGRRFRVGDAGRSVRGRLAWRAAHAGG